MSRHSDCRSELGRRDVRQARFERTVLLDRNTRAATGSKAESHDVGVADRKKSMQVGQAVFTRHTTVLRRCSASDDSVSP